MKCNKKLTLTGMTMTCLVFGNLAFADRSQQDIQNQLNQQVLSQSFNVQDDATLTKSVDEATERGKPTKSKAKDNYYRYWYNGFYYPHPYSYYGYSRYWY
ncbi:MAG: hypothetical protein ABL933_04730 [Methyloglobulus sp.]|nr:hypothetical protein [Methyloglobulus sp.]